MSTTEKKESVKLTFVVEFQLDKTIGADKRKRLCNKLEQAAYGFMENSINVRVHDVRAKWLGSEIVGITVQGETADK